MPAKTLNDLIALLKTQPGKLNYASAGNGAANHLAMELFKSMAGVNITHIPYKGAPQAVSDVLAGHMNMMFAGLRSRNVFWPARAGDNALSYPCPFE